MSQNRRYDRKPTAERTLQACEILERTGPMSANDLAKLFRLETDTLKSYLTRAVNHGLVTADRTFSPIRYAVPADWRSNITLLKPTAKAPIKFKESITAHAIRTQPNSVFSMHV